jgi:hypothetical protein
VNAKDDEMNSDRGLSDELLDRLVDGELDPAEYAGLLRSLDEIPDGWKKCGLAFLEAQAWQTDLEPRHREPVAVVPPVQSGRRRKASRGGGARLLVLAASGLLMFGLGQLSGRAWRAADDPVTTRAAGEHARLAGADPLGDARSLRTDDELLPDDSLPDSHPLREDDLATRWDGNSAPWGNLQLQVDDAVGWQGNQFDVPVYNLRGDAAQQMLSDRSAFTPEMVQEIERMGNRIHRQQGVMPVPLADGNEVLVPYEQVEIVPIGRPLFQ